MTDTAPQNFKATEQDAEKSVQKSPETAKQDGVIADKTNQETYGQAKTVKHQNDSTLSEPDMIAMGKDETAAEYNARVAQIADNRFGFYDSTKEDSGSAAETGTVIDYQHKKIGEKFYAGGMDYEEGRDTRSVYEKLSDFGRVAASRATDPEGQQAYVQGQLDKFIGIGEGLNIAKDSMKASVVAGWTALTDGTVANFLAKPNAINDPLFHAVGGALDAMAKDPNAVNHALERVGTIIRQGNERYTVAPNREQGHVIGETMFAMVNPEGSTKAGQAALKIADQVATHVDATVMKTIQQSIKASEEVAKTSPEIAEMRQMLQDYLRGKGLAGPDLEYAGVPPGFFDDIQHRASKDDTFFAMSKADDLGREGENKLRSKAGAGGDWPTINERPSPDAVRQAERYSCVSAVGEMLSEGKISQAELIERLGDPGKPVPTQFLARELGPGWSGGSISDEDLNVLLSRQNSSWAAELREPMGNRYARLEPAHTVVVDGLDVEGNIMIRDPAHGTRYEMTRNAFEMVWTGIVVFRK